jgi:hypothetical protein
MQYAQSPPLVEKDWLTAEETSSGGPARDLDARSDQRIGEAVDPAGRERSTVDW